MMWRALRTLVDAGAASVDVQVMLYRNVFTDGYTKAPNTSTYTPETDTRLTSGADSGGTPFDT